jgi:large subunit ribosomal protein L1
MKKLSKRMAALSTKIEDRIYAPLEALSIIKENANAKFDETIEAHIRLGIDPKYTDQQLRTTVALPHGTGQSIKIAVITSGENVSKAKAAGADLFGEEDLVESINKGNMEFDLLIATPDMITVIRVSTRGTLCSEIWLMCLADILLVRFYILLDNG